MHREPRAEQERCSLAVSTLWYIWVQYGVLNTVVSGGSDQLILMLHFIIMMSWRVSYGLTSHEMILGYNNTRKAFLCGVEKTPRPHNIPRRRGWLHTATWMNSAAT